MGRTIILKGRAFMVKINAIESELTYITDTLTELLYMTKELKGIWEGDAASIWVKNAERILEDVRESIMQQRDLSSGILKAADSLKHVKYGVEMLTDNFMTDVI